MSEFQKGTVTYLQLQNSVISVESEAVVKQERYFKEVTSRKAIAVLHDTVISATNKYKFKNLCQPSQAHPIEVLTMLCSASTSAYFLSN